MDGWMDVSFKFDDKICYLIDAIETISLSFEA